MRSFIAQKYADLLGIISAILCIIHCLLVPVLLIVGSFTEELWHHWDMIDYLFILLAGVAVWNAAKHASRSIATGMWISMVVFSIGLLLHEVMEEAIWISTAGSVALAILHLKNYKYSHRHSSIKA